MAAMERVPTASAAQSQRVFWVVFALGAACLAVAVDPWADGVFSFAGDTMCAAAYWRELLRPDLTVVMGAAQTKPLQVLLYGVAADLEAQWGPWVSAVTPCVLGALLLASVTQVSFRLGGRLSAVVTFLGTADAFMEDIRAGQASFAQAGLVWLGVWQYAVTGRAQGIGLLLLCLAPHFRVEAFAVLAVMFLVHAAQRQWRQALKVAVAAAVSAAAWLWVVLRVQGTWSRLDSGNAAGYFSFDAAAGQSGWTHLDGALASLAADPGVTFNAVLALWGTAWALVAARQIRAIRRVLPLWAVAANAPVLVGNVLVLAGTINLHYLLFLPVLGQTMGVVAVFRTLRLLSHNTRRLMIPVCTGFLVMAPVKNALVFGASGRAEQPQPPSYVEDGRLLAKMVEPGTRLLTEDDILYVLLLVTPDRFPSLRALQELNVLTRAQQADVLAHSDRIFVATRGHFFFYLRYNARPQWAQDPLHRVLESLASGQVQEATFGDSRLRLLERLPQGVLLEVRTPDIR